MLVVMTGELASPFTAQSIEGKVKCKGGAHPQARRYMRYPGGGGGGGGGGAGGLGNEACYVHFALLVFTCATWCTVLLLLLRLLLLAVRKQQKLGVEAWE